MFCCNILLMVAVYLNKQKGKSYLVVKQLNRSYALLFQILIAVQREMFSPAGLWSWLACCSNMLLYLYCEHRLSVGSMLYNSMALFSSILLLKMPSKSQFWETWLLKLWKLRPKSMKNSRGNWKKRMKTRCVKIQLSFQITFGLLNCQHI